MVSLLVIRFSTILLVRLHIYIDLLKLKAYKLFENSDADLFWLLIQRSQLVLSWISHQVPFRVTDHIYIIVDKLSSTGEGSVQLYTLEVSIAANYKGVCLQNTSKSHAYHLKIWRLL